MTPNSSKTASPNPGLPGFARFWGAQISHLVLSPEQHAYGAICVSRPRLSLKKVLPAAVAEGLVRRHGVGPSTYKTFFEESFKGAHFARELDDQNAQRKEGIAMPHT